MMLSKLVMGVLLMLELVSAFPIKISDVDDQNILTISVYYQESGSSEVAPLFIRGDNCGLNWTQGEPLSTSSSNASTNVYQIQLSLSSCTTANAQDNENGNDGAFLSFKTLYKDSEWQIGSNSMVSIKAGEFKVYPWYFATEGAYSVIATDVYSSYFNNTRDIIAYMPASWLENSHPEAVFETLIMHDGENVFNDSTSFGGRSWRAAETLDVGIQNGMMRPIAVIAPYNTAKRMAEYTPVKDPEYDGGEGDHYLDWLRDVMLPLIKDDFRLATDAHNLGILGSSLGGIISCYAGWTRGDEYNQVGCMSSSFWWDNQWFNNTCLVQDTPPSQDVIFYMDSGDQPAPDGDDKLQTIGVRDHMNRLGWTLDENLFYYLDKGGAHNEYYWGNRFWSPMQALYSPRVEDPQ